VNLDQSGNKCSKCGYHFDAAYVEKVKETEEMAKSKLDEMSDNACKSSFYFCICNFNNLMVLISYRFRRCGGMSESF